jgi:hypothetical protein
VIKDRSDPTDTGRMATLPPPLEKLLNLPVLRSELPAGFDHSKASALTPRYHTVGAVKIEFTNRTTTESVSFALFKTHAQAAAFARTERSIKTGGLFRIGVDLVGRVVIGAGAATRAQANALLAFGLDRLRRSW